MNSQQDQPIVETKDSARPEITTKIRIIEEPKASGDLARAYNFVRATTGQVPGIIKCFGARPDFLMGLVDLAYKIHFTDGHLSRLHKEMIASYVSHLNHCVYGVDSQCHFLRGQGASEQCVAAIYEGKLDEAGLTPAERVLLDYTRLITEAAYRSTEEDVQKVRDSGWSENQISEAVYTIGMFAFFNRVADAFGIPCQNYLGITEPLSRSTPFERGVNPL